MHIALQSSFALHLNRIHQNYFPDDQDQFAFECSCFLLHMVLTCLSINNGEPDPII
jgi:hypothetical protein